MCVKCTFINIFLCVTFYVNTYSSHFLFVVLLANVSALSAIRYLRKYVKDKAASEDILHFDS